MFFFTFISASITICEINSSSTKCLKKSNIIILSQRKFIDEISGISEWWNRIAGILRITTAT